MIIQELYKDLSDNNLKGIAEKEGCDLKISAFSIDIKKLNRVIRISLKHLVYSKHIIENFETYFCAVEPSNIYDLSVADFSMPKFHMYKDFELMPILTPSLPEPIHTTNDYLNFAQLRKGDVVLDLGGYCGVAAILMKDKVGKDGVVVTVEPDKLNITALTQNIKLYQSIKGMSPTIEESAIWIDSLGLEFSSEGNMGSSAVSIVGTNRGEIVKVNTITLSGLIKKHKLKKVNFIKCDIEGAEKFIFGDLNFFNNFRPKIIIEPHKVNGVLTIDSCVSQLKQFGYECRINKQSGVKSLPLIFCTPDC
jgi:FkbM family methyltransferase